MNPINIFRAGRHTGTTGLSLTISEADVHASAEAYDPRVHEAPLVIGHPSQSAPAYGWVSKLTASGADLWATPHQVHADFAELVRAGLYKKVSASFYSPEAKNNPIPGVYYLRHVGFLGAAAPAVKGLAGIEFGAMDVGVIEFAAMDLDFADPMHALGAPVYRSNMSVQEYEAYMQWYKQAYPGLLP